MSHPRIRLTDRLRLEPLAVGHTDDLLALFLHPAVAEWYGPWTREQVAREAARSMRSWSIDGVGKWMAYHRATGALVGRGGLSRQQVDEVERLELGWALHRRFWGQGYATEIGTAGLAFAFDELGAGEVVSFTEARNARSRAVMQRLGFRYRKDIRLHDELFAKALGYPGSMHLLVRYITQGRVEGDRPPISPRRLTSLVLTHPDHLSDTQANATTN